MRFISSKILSFLVVTTSLLSFALPAQAQVQATSNYLSDLTIYQPSNTFAGSFNAQRFFADSSLESGTSTVLFSSVDNVPSISDAQIISFDPDDATLGKVNFQIKTADHELDANTPHRFLYLSYRDTQGKVIATTPLDLSDATFGMKASNNTNFEQPLLVSVNWDRQKTKLVNAEDDKTGRWYFQFGTGNTFNELVKRSKPQEVILVAQDTSGGNPINLCIFGEGRGSSFQVSYPECASMSSLLNDHIFLPGKSYDVFFTDTSGKVINAESPSDGKRSLLLAGVKPLSKKQEPTS